jgi:hypothetical protein
VIALCCQAQDGKHCGAGLQVAALLHCCYSKAAAVSPEMVAARHPDGPWYKNPTVATRGVATRSMMQSVQPPSAHAAAILRPDGRPSAGVLVFTTCHAGGWNHPHMVSLSRPSRARWLISHSICTRSADGNAGKHDAADRLHGLEIHAPHAQTWSGCMQQHTARVGGQ